MLIEVSALTRKRLIQEEGFRLVREWAKDARHIWPDDPTEQKNHLVIIPSDANNAEQMFITSARVITIGSELPGGDMADDYGIVCAENEDGEARSQFVLGGGKVQPDFDGGSTDRLALGEDRELVRGAAVAENREELGIVFSPDDRGAYKHLFLFGVRGITDRPDPTTGRSETTQKRVGKFAVGDACFLAITHERLGYFGGQKGETGPRHVKRASELLRQLSREERSRGVLPMLPYAQATALALGIINAKKLFEKNMPPALAEIVADGEKAAEKILDRNSYARYFTPLVQEAPWEV